METLEYNVDYFRRGEAQNVKFWSRFHAKPSFEGLSVLDVGCGHGRLCVEMARAGARRVVGVDVKPNLIEFAAGNVRTNYPDLAGKIEFLPVDLKDFAPDAAFDIIVSKETFEHLVDLPGVLAEMKGRLKPGGRVYAGFGPLWKSPIGDHRLGHFILPWGHLMFPRRVLFRRVSRSWGRNIESVHDMGLNGLSFADYVRIIHASGFTTPYFAVNRGSHPVLRLFSLARMVPFLREYFTFNVYCVLEKPAEATARA